MTKLTCFRELILLDFQMSISSDDYQLSTEAMEAREKQLDSSKTRRQIFNSGNKTYKNAYYLAYKVPNIILYNQLNNWFESLSLVKDFSQKNSTDFFINMQTTWGAEWHSPHADHARRGQLIYVLEPGGNDVTTTWYQEVDNPTHRDHYIGNLVTDKNLIEIDSTQLKTKTWYYFCTDILHGAKGITEPRYSLCITFCNEEFHQKFLSDYINHH
jgi:hypothetical protein